MLATVITLFLVIAGMGVALHDMNKIFPDQLVDKLDNQILAFTNPMFYRANKALHTHDIHELFYCAKGDGTQKTEAGVISMKPGDLFFFPAVLPHIGTGTADLENLGYVINFSSAYFSSLNSDNAALELLKLLKETMHTKYGAVAIVDTNDIIRNIFEDIIEEFTAKRSGYELVIKGRMLDLFTFILRQSNLSQSLMENSSNVSSTDRIKTVCDFVKLHYNQHLTVNEAADLAGMSRSHFHACFKTTTGKSLLEYMHQVRIEKAVELLQSNKFTLTEVMKECGYNTPSQFYSVFKKVTGHSPKEIRGTQ